jgi:hypothetical protein
MMNKKKRKLKLHPIKSVCVEGLFESEFKMKWKLV